MNVPIFHNDFAMMISMRREVHAAQVIRHGAVLVMPSAARMILIPSTLIHTPPHRAHISAVSDARGRQGCTYNRAGTFAAHMHDQAAGLEYAHHYSTRIQVAQVNGILQISG